MMRIERQARKRCRNSLVTTMFDGNHAHAAVHFEELDSAVERDWRLFLVKEHTAEPPPMNMTN